MVCAIRPIFMHERALVLHASSIRIPITFPVFTSPARSLPSSVQTSLTGTLLNCWYSDYIRD